MSTIGDRIKERRTQMNMSQEELAKKMGYQSRSSINKIETGVNDVSQSKIVTFAKALDTTPAYLMGWEGTTPFNENQLLEIRDNLSSIFESVDSTDAHDFDASELVVFVSSIVAGEIIPTYEDIFRIADEYGCSVDEIFGRDKMKLKKKKPITIFDDGLTAKKRALIEKIKSLDDSDVDVVSATADAIIAQRE